MLWDKSKSLSLLKLNERMPSKVRLLYAKFKVRRLLGKIMEWISPMKLLLRSKISNWLAGVKSLTVWMKFCDKSRRIKFFNSNTSEGTDCKLLFGKLKDFNDVFNEFNADGSMDSK